MCIISFYKDNNQVLLTHNRDESITRIASSTVEERLWDGRTYFAPVDQEKSGTWIFYNQDYIACILNGGKEKSQNLRTEYKKSRGLVLLDVMKYKDVDEFVKKYDFEDIAPFTMLVHQLNNKKTLMLFWNEKQLEIKDLSDDDFTFRCSSTLYTLEKMHELEKIFPKFSKVSPKDIFSIHQSIKMNDGDITKGKATTSITQIFVNNSEISMKYCPFF